ncbi:MAG: hypothetical protein JSW12_12600, partial [Deltaproteobacteria bacterium]
RAKWRGTSALYPRVNIREGWRGHLWQGRFLSGDTPEEEIALVRTHERTGRPLGADGFIDWLDRTSGRILHRQKPGPKPKQG